MKKKGSIMAESAKYSLFLDENEVLPETAMFMMKWHKLPVAKRIAALERVPSRLMGVARLMYRQSKNYDTSFMRLILAHLRLMLMESEDYNVKLLELLDEAFAKKHGQVPARCIKQRHQKTR